MLRDSGNVRWVVATIEQAAVHVGVQGFDAAVEHLREAGEVRDIADGEASVAQGFGGTARGDQFGAEAGQRAGELDEACLVGYGEQGTLNRLESTHCLDSTWAIFHRRSPALLRVGITKEFSSPFLILFTGNLAGGVPGLQYL